MTQIDDTGTVLRAQVKIGNIELLDHVPFVQQYGFSSVPPINTDLVVLFVAGDRSNGAVIGSNHQATKPKGRQKGETTIFNNVGMSIYLSANGIVINGGGKPVLITNGDLHVDGNIVWQAATTPTTAETHKHTDEVNQPTGPPIPGS